MKNERLTAVDRFARLGERLKQDGRLQIDQAKLELSEKIYDTMQAKRITEAELARRLGTTRAYVNKVLQGATNFTIESLVKIGVALECELKLEFAEPQKQGSIFDDDIIYIEVEEPIDEPLVASTRLDERRTNVIDFADYMKVTSTPIESGESDLTTMLEKTDAAVQNAA